MIVIRVKLNPDLAPRENIRPAPGETAAALREVWPLPTLILGVLGGIFLGIMTPTEAGAVGIWTCTNTFPAGEFARCFRLKLVL